jgi:hypothetical protein
VRYWYWARCWWPILTQRLGFLTIFLMYATAIQHDRFAQCRARVGAVNEVLAAGIPVTAMSGGWDFDGWTELQRSGRIVDPRMRARGFSATCFRTSCRLTRSHCVQGRFLETGSRR